MREYRYPNSIKWGDTYNPDTGMHHILANDYDAARRAIPGYVAGPSIQVHTASGWQFAETVSERAGGYDRGRLTS